MRIGVPRETVPGERRVALVPESVGRLVKSGVEVVVERDAGRAAYFVDDAYRAAGASLVDAAAAFGADVVLKVQKPTAGEVTQLREGAILISLLPPAASGLSVMMIPVVGVFSGMLMLGERPFWEDYVALALILLALSTVLLPSRAAR